MDENLAAARFHFPRLVVMLLLALILSACGSKGPYMIDLMPAPGLYADGVFNPFSYVNPGSRRAESQIFYATDRDPATVTPPISDRPRSVTPRQSMQSLLPHD